MHTKQSQQITDFSDQDKWRAAITLNSISDAVICTDIHGNINYLNTAAEKITGWTRAEANGVPISQVFKIINSQTRQRVESPVAIVLRSNKARELAEDTVLITRHGNELAIEDSTSPIHDEDHELTGVVIVFHDVSVAKELARKMAYLAQHDYLTSLPNRALLKDRISQSIAVAKRDGVHLAILFMDLDNFKQVNDSLGHEIGDAILQAVALRLADCVRSSDTISRLGGDEFVVLLREDKQAADAAATAEKILAAMIVPHTIHQHVMYLSASIGISIYPSDGQDAETLIKNADTAMYQVKKHSKSNYQFFNAQMNIHVAEKQFIEHNLRLAIEKNELTLHYQPKVNLATGQITGAEALLRWAHPEWGEVTPERFIPIAEETGLILPIGCWVLTEACAQAKRWTAAGYQPITMAVNISAKEFTQRHFVRQVQNALTQVNLDAHCLELEITETSLMSDAESSIMTLNALKALGVNIAVDDFGTGYSSLSYLKKFPIDVLKIDQSFVHEMNGAHENEDIVTAIIRMGNSLNLRVICEGIENPLQLCFLKLQQCDEGQGYLFSKPLNAEAFGALLASPSTDWCDSVLNEPCKDT
jgi:diguanylate cyclase (GGDEF)-like protein/PAS domain S-box-containing protein